MTNITSVTIDLRNFTSMFHGLLDLNSESRHKYLSYIQEYIQLCITYAKRLGFKDELDFITTGDGVIIIFKDENHNIRAYIFTLVINKILTNYISKIKEEDLSGRIKDIDFGIGIDSGKSEILYFSDGLRNHLSDAINISSRLEGMTKVFIGKKIIISSAFFWPIINLLYKEEFIKKYDKSSYHEIVDYARKLEASNDKLKAKEIWNLMTLINESLFFRYLSGISLKGLESPKIAYSFSKTLFKMNINKFLEIHEYKLKNIFKTEYSTVCSILKDWG